jgi:hypothetical protein
VGGAYCFDKLQLSQFPIDWSYPSAWSDDLFEDMFSPRKSPASDVIATCVAIDVVLESMLSVLEWWMVYYYGIFYASVF